MSGIKINVNRDEYELSISNEKNDKFIMHYAAGDLYWTMFDYHSDNEFCISKEDKTLYTKLEELFNIIRINDNLSGNLLIGNCFEWVSEAYGLKEDANRLKIIREEDKFTISFFQNSDRLFGRRDICAICFCLSGSNYQDIANAFSIMLHEYFEEEKQKSKVLK